MNSFPNPLSRVIFLISHTRDVFLDRWQLSAPLISLKCVEVLALFLVCTPICQIFWFYEGKNALHFQQKFYRNQFPLKQNGCVFTKIMWSPLGGSAIAHARTRGNVTFDLALAAETGPITRPSLTIQSLTEAHSLAFMHARIRICTHKDKKKFCACVSER